jgi:RNA polymerase primary sigma factor
MEKLDEGLKTLLDLGKRRGFLTFDQVNDFLPDEAASPEKIQGLLESLDEIGDRPDQRGRGGGPPARLGRRRRRAR